MDFNLPINLNTQTGSAQQVSIDLALGGLPAEDSFSARVIFVGNDSVHLKLEDGSVLKARLEGQAQLTLGSVITLETVERSDESVVLRIAEAPQGQAQEMLGEGRVISDTVLQHLAQQLQNPELSAQQKLDLLMQMLFQQAPGAEQAQPEQLLPGQTANPAPPINPEAQMGQMLSELLGLLAEAIPEGEQAPPPAATLLAEQPAPTAEPAPPAAEQPTAAPANNLPPDAPVRLLTAALFSLLEPANLPAEQQLAFEPPTLPATEGQPLPQAAEALPQQALATEADAARQAADLVTQLQELPKAEDLPPQKIQEFVELAREIVQDLRPQEGQQLAPKQVQEFVERLFAAGSERTPEAAGLLKKAVRELDVRLAFLEEAIERSSLGNKNDLLAQLQRLTTHSESLRQTDRYLYAQIPIYFEQERKTAELYVYRRRDGKNGGRIDPQNATILLALNTQHLGRVETYVQFKAREISLKMEIARHEAVPYLQEKSVSLYGLFTQAGYKLTSSNILPLKQKTNPDNAEQALTEFSGSFGRPYGVDVKI